MFEFRVISPYTGAVVARIAADSLDQWDDISKEWGSSFRIVCTEAVPDVGCRGCREAACSYDAERGRCDLLS